MKQFLERNRWSIVLAMSMCLFALTLCTAVLAAGRVETGIVLPGFDIHAVEGAPDIGQANGYSFLDDEALSFSVGLCGRPVASADGLDVYLTNPEGNDTWLMVQAMDADGGVIGRTGLVRPGEYVKSVPGNYGGYGDISLKVMAYVPDLYYSDGSVLLRTTVG